MRHRSSFCPLADLFDRPRSLGSREPVSLPSGPTSRSSSSVARVLGSSVLRAASSSRRSVSAGVRPCTTGCPRSRVDSAPADSTMRAALTTAADEPTAAAHSATRRLPRFARAARHATRQEAIPSSSPAGAANGFQAESAAQIAKTSAACGRRLRVGCTSPGMAQPRSSAWTAGSVRSRSTIRPWAASASASVSVRWGAR